MQGKATGDMAVAARAVAARAVGLAGLAMPFWAAPALAHHAMGGETPQTLWQGFASGLAHPVIGLDHLAFVVAAGLLAAPFAARLLLPAAFLIAGWAGFALHLGGADIAFAEGAIALSVLAFGVIVLAGRRLPARTLALLFAAAGLFHGYALAESVIGAEPAPVASYVAGLTVVQYLIALLAMAAARRIGALRLPALQAAGAVIALFGLFQLSAAVIG